MTEKNTCLRSIKRLVFILPENVSIVRDDYGYCVKDSKGETLLHYYDRGPFYDRTVTVDKINITLE